MALFGLVWLLRLRSEMKRCAKCRRRELAQQAQERTSVPSFYTIDTTGPLHGAASVSTPGTSSAPTTYCEVHGYNPRKEGKMLFSSILYI